MENFNSIYSENHRMVLNFINLKINDYTIAEELTNDVFMRVHKHLENYDSEKSAMKTWVMNIAKNIVIDHYRKVKQDAISLDSSTSNDEDSKITILDRMSTNSNPYKEMVSKEVYSRIEDEFLSLDEKYFDVANLFFIDGLSYNEISEELNIPLNTVKVQLSRARKMLQKKLETV
jgi:RNA polymerase sigma-70 factor (ECF subfamily)